jgi:hypothetical protein
MKNLGKVILGTLLSLSVVGVCESKETKQYAFIEIKARLNSPFLEDFSPIKKTIALKVVGASPSPFGNVLDLVCEHITPPGSSGGCYLDRNKCNSSLPMKFIYTIRLGEISGITPDTGRDIDISVRNCEFIAKPKNILVTYESNRSLAIARAIVNYQNFTMPSDSLGIARNVGSLNNAVEWSAYLEDQLGNEQGAMGVVSWADTNRDLSALALESAAQFPKNSNERDNLMQLSVDYQKQAVFTANISLQSIVGKLQKHSSGPWGVLNMAISGSLTDYSNNIIKLQSNRADFSSLYGSANPDSIGAKIAMENFDLLLQDDRLDNRANQAIGGLVNHGFSFQ